MLSERYRNTIVGLTMLLTLVGVMFGIFLLGRFPFVPGIATYPITLNAAHANGLMPGNKVDFNGVDVGTVASVSLATDPTTRLSKVQIVLTINGSQKIPDNASAFLGKQTIGTAYVSLFSDKPAPKFLPTDGTATLKASSADSGIIPKQVVDDITSLKLELDGLSRDVRKVATDLHVLLDYTTPEQIAAADPNDPKRPKENISTVVIRLNRAVASIETLVADPQITGNVKTIIQNIADSSAQLKTTLQSINTTAQNADTALSEIGGTAKKLGDAATHVSDTTGTTEKQILLVSTKLVDTLDSLEKATQLIAKGEGTTGKLINDPRLYDSLLDLSKSLKSTTDDLNLLLRKWKDEGVNLKLK